MISLGQKMRFLPGQYDQEGKRSKGTSYAKTGTVVYINKPHRYFTLETETDIGKTYRESFKFSQIQKGLIR